MMPDSNDPFDERSSPSQFGQPIAAMGQTMRNLLRQFLAILGLVLIVLGIPLAFLTPIPGLPIGLTVVILGVILLGRNSVWGRNWMEGVMERHPTIERFAPNWLMRLVFGREKIHHHKTK